MSRYGFSRRFPADGTIKGSYGGQAYSEADLANHRVTVDPGGTKRPIMAYNPNDTSEHYVTTIQRVVEHVDVPVLVTEHMRITQSVIEPASLFQGRPQFNIAQYRRPSPAEVESMEKHGVATDKIRRPSSPIPVGDHRHLSPTDVEPVKNYGVTNNKWDKPSAPVQDQRYHSPTIQEPWKNYGVIDDKWDKPSSPVQDQRYSSPTKQEPWKNYEVVNDKWDKPSTQVQGQRYSSPTKQEPWKNYGVINDKRDNPSNPIRDHRYTIPTKDDEMRNYGVGNNKQGKASNTAGERPEKVEEFITNVQTEANRPTRSGLLSGNNWRNMPNSKDPYSSNAYGEYPNSKNQDFDKPIIDTKRNERSGNPYGLGQNDKERPGHKERTMPLNQGTPVFRPTNDIGEAVQILKEAVSSAPQTWYNLNYSDSRDPKRETYPRTIDSREAQRRYGNLNLSARPFQTGENYMGIIDSKDAARKYGGKPV